MRIYRHYANLPARVRGAVVAIGNFDGVHLGHQAVIGRAREIAEQTSAVCTALTFEPHPRSFFDAGGPAFRLTPFRSKAHQVAGLGVEHLVVLRFDSSLAAMAARDFVETVLVEGLGAAHVVVGYDFVFGKGRAGNCALLASMAEQAGFALTVLDPVAGAGEIYSSSRIREALRQGRPQAAARLLGRWWELEGRVAPGDRRGRGLGYPTANLSLDDYLQPALGIYAVRAGLAEDGELGWRDAVASLGRRPTFGGKEVLLEVHVFDYAGDLYGRHLRVAFVDYIREEKTFGDVESLKRQMALDCEDARRLLRDAAVAGEGTGAAAPWAAQQQVGS